MLRLAFSTRNRPLTRAIQSSPLFHLAEKNRGLDVKRCADIEDRPQGRIGLSEFDQADESTLVASFRGQRVLAHLLP
jgi:hypothetical protein